MVGEQQDAQHPKVKAVVERVIDAWHADEKTLLFYFRSNTARRLRDILGERIAAELSARTRRCLGGEKSMRALRGRLTLRDGDLIVLGLDRVLWSALCALRDDLEPGAVARSLHLTPEDLLELARLGLRYRIGLDEDTIDRVFLTRATEHVLARRLLLEALAQPDWVESPYGLSADADTDGVGEDAASFDERGVHAAYRPRAEPDEAQVRALAASIEVRRERARHSGRVPVHDGYCWKGDSFDWEGRRRLLQALRRAVLRESVLVRLLPEREDREESGWGELLVSAFFAPMKGQSESMAHRMGVFLEDVSAASGDLLEPSSARYALLEATRLKDGTFVSLVHGGTDQATRERAFAGFNTPLLPEVLICTSVGAEGIDLHRHCRHVIHYDLAWNPAVVDQRTGRVDRIGSKMFRERVLSIPGEPCFLEVSVPFLEGTYDERMFEELRLRAQMFEVLTGGEVSADHLERRDDNPEGRDDVDAAEGTEEGVRLVALPAPMVEDLRVRLHVWEETSSASAAPVLAADDSEFACLA